MHLLFATVPGPAQKYIQGTKFSPFLRVLTHGINALLSVGGTLTIAHIINHYHNTTNPPANNPSLPFPYVCVWAENQNNTPTVALLCLLTPPSLSPAPPVHHVHATLRGIDPGQRW